MNDGFYIVGLFTGVNARNWQTANGEKRTSHSILVTRPWVDDYGLPQNQTYRVDIHSDDLNRINAESGDWVKKRIMVPVTPMARGGRNSPFVTYYMPKDSKVTVLPDKPNALKEAS